METTLKKINEIYFPITFYRMKVLIELEKSIKYEAFNDEKLNMRLFKDDEGQFLHVGWSEQVRQFSNM